MRTGSPRPGSVGFIGRPGRGLPPLTHAADADVTIAAYLLVRVCGKADAAQRERQEQDRRGAGCRKRNG